MTGGRGLSKSIWAWPPRPERRRNAAIVAASVLFHVLVLGVFGLRTIGLDSQLISDPPRPTILVQLEPRPMLADETPRQPMPARQLEAPPLARTLNTPVIRDDEDDDEKPIAPSPRAATVAPGAPAAQAQGAWTVRPRTLGDRIGQGLRTSTVGCTAPDLLSAAERAICDDRFGRRAAAARPIDETSNSPFAREGARRLAEYEIRRRPLAGGSGNVGPQDGPGSNFGMGVAGALLDPSLRPDSTENIRTRRDGPR